MSKRAKKIERQIISLELEMGAAHVKRVRLYEAAEARLAGKVEIARLKKLIMKQAAEIKRLRAAKRR